MSCWESSWSQGPGNFLITLVFSLFYMKTCYWQSNEHILSHFSRFLCSIVFDFPKWIWDSLAKVKVQIVGIEGSKVNKLMQGLNWKPLHGPCSAPPCASRLALFKGWHPGWLLLFLPFSVLTGTIVGLSSQLIWSILFPPTIKIK